MDGTRDSLSIGAAKCHLIRRLIPWTFPHHSPEAVRSGGSGVSEEKLAGDTVSPRFEVLGISFAHTGQQRLLATALGKVLIEQQPPPALVLERAAHSRVCSAATRQHPAL